MKRIYLVIPSVDVAIKVCETLKDLEIKKEDMHVLVKDEQDKLEMSRIPEAGVLHTTDVIHAFKQGSVVGLIAGVLAGSLAVEFPPEGLSLGLGTIIAVGIFGLLFGAWVSTLIGVSIPNPSIEKFKKAVEAGGILMLVDLPEEAEAKILQSIQQQHPETSVHSSKNSF